MKKQNIISAAILAVGLLALGLCVKSGLNSFNDSQRVVDVKGLAEREVNANVVTWPIMFREVGNSLPDVYANVTKTNAVIIDFLVANGLSKDEISVGAPTVQDLTTDRYNNSPLPTTTR